MKHAADGVTIWYGDELTPVPVGEVAADTPVSVTIGVRPPNVGDGVEIEFRVNDGPTRVLQSRPLERSGDAQRFLAAFPYLPPGSRVAYAPRVRSFGRRIGPPLPRNAPASFSIAPRQAPARDARHVDRPVPASTPREPFPFTLERVAQVHATLAPPVSIGPTPEGLRINYQITGGAITGPRFNATVETGGGDCLRILDDGIGIVAVRTTLRGDDGGQIYTEYSGVLDLGANGYAEALQGRFPPKPQIHLAPRFTSASPNWAWLNRYQFMGIGFVTMATLTVDYDLYALRLADTGPGTGSPD